MAFPVPCANCPAGTGYDASLGETGMEHKCRGCRAFLPIAPEPAEPVSEPPPPSSPATPTLPTGDPLTMLRAELSALEDIIARAEKARPRLEKVRRAIEALTDGDAS